MRYKVRQGLPFQQRLYADETNNDYLIHFNPFRPMKWTYSIRNKIAASGALFTLCVLVLFSNYIDRDHTNNVKNSISTLYEDRLIVEDYILKMTIDTYEIKQALNLNQLDEHSADQVTALLSH